jgi:ubiquinone/menaquinone biosynthesis C-methylase UbiE
MPAAPDYIHALRFASLTALYDPIVACTCRGQTVKATLLDGANLESGHRVLDVGCGTGTLACMIAKREPGVEIHGLDGDAEILERARRKSAAFPDQITFSHGMADHMPFPDHHFDTVLSSLFFHHLDHESKYRTLTEIKRVLKPTGSLHVADWGAAQDPLMRAAFLVIQLLDGFKMTRDNVRGMLPGLMGQAGFVGVKDQRIRTMVGTIEIIRARKKV